MSATTFLEHLRATSPVTGEGRITDFLSRVDGRLLFGNRIDLQGLVAQYGAPLEVAFCPLITQQVHQMQDWAAGASAELGYHGKFLYAYATKANFAEEVVRTAITSGAQYETSSVADVMIAQHLWMQGVLPNSRYIFCNGSKERNYIAAIVRLREAGFATIVPILDDLEELESYLRLCSQPLLLGVRERHAAHRVNAAHSGGERFGLTQDEIAQVAARLEGTPHKLVVYHAMVGSQIEQLDTWIERLSESAAAYARLRQHVPSLHMFNFGGGMPTSAYDLNFSFDYGQFWRRLMGELATVAAAHGIPQPDIVGEFGRYTCASHSVFLFEIGAMKESQGAVEPWYLVNGSMMISLPDIMIVPEQTFITLPVDGWDMPVRPARMGGRRSCDSDDVFPQPQHPPLMLPVEGEGTVVAVFGVGAYQQMLAGRGGAHHCLNPEMRRLIIEQDGDMLVVREVPQQDVSTIMRLLGYAPEAVEAPHRLPVREPVYAEVPRRTISNPRRRTAVQPRATSPRRQRWAARS